MQSGENQRNSRTELQKLIFSVNKIKRQSRIKRTPKFLFRALVRTVINNLKWLTAEDVTDEKLMTKQPKLSIRTKAMLRVPVEERTPEVKEMLYNVMGQLHCFDRYPEKVRDGLTAAAMFTYFPPGRVLVAEGHPSVAMYFFLSGQANVTKKVYDAGMRTYIPQDVGVINTGFAFGEINILHDEPWPTTVTTVSHVEILTILKENFQMILEEFLGKQRREITNCMNQFSYFKDWNQRSIVECCILARIVHFKKDEIILGDNCGNTENSYFIVSGSCKVIYQLQIQHIPRKQFTELKIINHLVINEEETFPTSYLLRNIEMPKRKKIADPLITSLIVDGLLTQLINELPLLETSKETSQKKGKPTVQYIQNHFFQIMEMLPGACFGVGESLENKFILSESHSVTLLCIPKYVIKSHNSENVWGRIREMYNNTYPTPRGIFSQFLIDRRWNKSRKKYMETLIKAERPFTGLTSAEAPYHVRLTTDFENPIFCRIKKIISE